MSNIEDDIKVLRNIEKLRAIEFKHCVTDREVQAIKNILSEREQRYKRIKELEELNEVFFNNYKEQKQLKEEQALNIAEVLRSDYISKKEIKNKIKELEKLVYGIQKSETCEEYPCGEDIIYRTQIDILQELLEGEK